MSNTIPLTIQAFKYGAEFLIPTPDSSNSTIKESSFWMARFIYGFGTFTIAPIIGVGYHTFKAIQNRVDLDANARKKAWSHLKAAGIDLAIAAISIAFFLITRQTALHLPVLQEKINRISRLPLNLENLTASMDLQKRIQGAQAVFILPLTAPLIFAFAPTFFSELYEDVLR